MREHELERSALPVAGSLHVRVSAEVRGGVAEQRRLRVEQKRGPPRGDGGVRVLLPIGSQTHPAPGNCAPALSRRVVV